MIYLEMKKVVIIVFLCFNLLYKYYIDLLVIIFIFFGYLRLVCQNWFDKQEN